MFVHENIYCVKYTVERTISFEQKNQNKPSRDRNWECQAK
jgi:hypothetical protein